MHTAEIDATAYELGRRDYSFGKRQIQNPYKQGTLEWRSWDTGWSDERDEHVQADLIPADVE